MKKTYIDKYESKQYNIGKIRITVNFSNGKTCDLTLMGSITETASRRNSKGDYEATEYYVIKAEDNLESLISSLEGDCKYIISDSGIIYNLDTNEVDFLEIKENDDLVINKNVFTGTEVLYE